MATIKERAKSASEGYDDDGYSAGLYMGYVVGATAQKAIDIENAWQWMVDWVFENAPHEVFDELMSSREDYIKSMEE